MNIILLLLIFEVKHFICDFLLQGHYMTGKFNKSGWILPLSSHCLVHAIFTYSILTFIGCPLSLILSIFDFTVHFIMDRVKASPDLLGKFKPLYGTDYLLCVRMKMTKQLNSNRLFWWSLGFDQLVHQTTSLIIVGLAML